MVSFDVQNTGKMQGHKRLALSVIHSLLTHMSPAPATHAWSSSQPRVGPSSIPKIQWQQGQEGVKWGLGEKWLSSQVGSPGRGCREQGAWDDQWLGST